MHLHPAAEPGEPFVAPDADQVAAERVQRDREAPAVAGPPVDVAAVADREVAGVGTRVYAPHRPGEGPGEGPGAIVYLHGGGWVFGSLETADATCRRLADRSGMVVVSVAYRLSPEATWPDSIDDGDRVLAAVARGSADAPELAGVDPARVVVCGDSAGGFLALVLAGRARDDGRPLAGQALVYPVVRRAALDHLDDAVGTVDGLCGEAMRWYWDQFLGDVDTSGAPAEVDPTRGSLAGLPPTLVLMAEHDVLRAEGEALAEDLQAAGVDVVATRWLGMPHGFFRQFATYPAAAAAVDQVAAWCREAAPA